MQYEILQDGTGNYLKVRGTDREEISDRIFTYQEIAGFLPLELRWINGQKECIYNISGKISLRKYLEKGDFSRKDMQKLFLQVFDMADCMEEYLLDSRSVVIQEEFLFYNPSQGNWEGLYKEDYKQGTAESAGRLLELIMEKMNQKDKELVFFVYGMHKLTRGADCTRNMLREYISEEISKNDGVESKDVSKDMTLCLRSRSVSCLPADRQRSRTIVIRGCLLPGMILAAGMILPAALWWMGMFRLPLSGKTDWIKAAGAILFFLAVAGYGVWKTMPGSSHETEKKHMIHHNEEREQNKVCLIPQTGTEDAVPIPRFPYRLRAGHSGNGRQSCVNILQEAGVVMVVDEESGQEVFHNDRKLLSWQKTRLEDGDLLRIGEHKYVVEITQPEYVM